jgi:hypothetical protein
MRVRTGASRRRSIRRCAQAGLKPFFDRRNLPRALEQYELVADDSNTNGKFIVALLGESNGDFR